MISRRGFLLGGAAAASAFAGLRLAMGSGQGLERAAGQASSVDPFWRFGPLKPDPAGLIDLPEGFRYRRFSEVGELMNDGLRVPARHDGMAAFPAEDGRVILIRNHELAPKLNVGRGAFGVRDDISGYAHADRLYDAGFEHPSLGGTTTVLYNPANGEVEKHFLSLGGTELNCAGGPTPWGTWISCEETVSRADQLHRVDHGYCFEVPAQTDDLRPVVPVPLKAMGRFVHEAICVDPRTGIVYLTEDLGDGLFYRFIPNTPGKLAEGGRLQALAIIGAPRRDTGNLAQFNMRPFPAGEAMACEWLDLRNPESPKNDLRLQGYAAGAARFVRGEGIWWAGDRLYFTCTQGGVAGIGQVFCYQPSPAEGSDAESEQPGELTLFVESHDAVELTRPDNITVSPWGDMIICEDTRGTCGLVGVTPEGRLYRLARNAMNQSEFAGGCFSPDGKILFANIQEPGITLAIEGPWGALRA